MRAWMLMVGLAVLSCDQGNTGQASDTESTPGVTPRSDADVQAAALANQQAVPAGVKTGEPLTPDKPQETDEYTLALEAPASVKAGQKATASVVLTAAKGWKLNREFPTKLQVTPPEGVTLEKASWGMGDSELTTEPDKGGKEQKIRAAKWTISFTPSAAGEKAFTGSFRFAVCTDSTCNPKSAQLAFRVPVSK